MLIEKQICTENNSAIDNTSLILYEFHLKYKPLIKKIINDSTATKK